MDAGYDRPAMTSRAIQIWRLDVIGCNIGPMPSLPKNPTSKGDKYRQRSNVLAKRMKSSIGTVKATLAKKKKALDDMADNEDWLDGKPLAKK